MIDHTKTTPEKLSEMNDSLIVDNNYLRERLKLIADTFGINPKTLELVQAPVIASEQKPVGEVDDTGCYSGMSRIAILTEPLPYGTKLFTSPPNTAEIEQRVAEAFVTKFKRHVGGDGEFWLHELEDFCEDGKWREYV